MGYLFEAVEPASPSGAGGAASSALSLGLDDVAASPAASLLASEAVALGANVTVIMNTSTEGSRQNVNLFLREPSGGAWFPDFRIPILISSVLSQNPPIPPWNVRAKALTSWPFLHP